MPPATLEVSENVSSQTKWVLHFHLFMNFLNLFPGSHVTPVLLESWEQSLDRASVSRDTNLQKIEESKAESLQSLNGEHNHRKTSFSHCPTHKVVPLKPFHQIVNKHDVCTWPLKLLKRHHFKDVAFAKSMFYLLLTSHTSGQSTVIAGSPHHCRFLSFFVLQHKREQVQLPSPGSYSFKKGTQM